MLKMWTDNRLIRIDLLFQILELREAIEKIRILELVAHSTTKISSLWMLRWCLANKQTRIHWKGVFLAADQLLSEVGFCLGDYKTSVFRPLWIFQSHNSITVAFLCIEWKNYWSWDDLWLIFGLNSSFRSLFLTEILLVFLNGFFWRDFLKKEW